MIFSGAKKNQDDFHAEAVPHMDALFSAALYMTRDRSDAEDLVQETFVKAYRFFHRYKRGTNCKAWLFRIMTNTHINRNRGKKREFSFIDNVDADIDTNPITENSSWYKNPEQTYLHGLVHDDVKAALDSLPPEFRLVIVLSDLQGFSYKEVAELVDCPIGTVMSRLHRGRKLLQRRLKKYAKDAGYFEVEAPENNPTSLEDYRKRRTGEE
jgi:RNA polymerase sigma-70 factor (ECF subfamily)